MGILYKEMLKLLENYWELLGKIVGKSPKVTKKIYGFL